MAGKISWQLEILGLSKAITDLRTFNNLLDSVSKKVGLLGGGRGGNIIGGGGGGNIVVLPGGGTSGAGGYGGGTSGAGGYGGVGPSLAGGLAGGLAGSVNLPRTTKQILSNMTRAGFITQKDIDKVRMQRGAEKYLSNLLPLGSVPRFNMNLFGGENGVPEHKGEVPPVIKEGLSKLIEKMIERLNKSILDSAVDIMKSKKYANLRPSQAYNQILKDHPLIRFQSMGLKALRAFSSWGLPRSFMAGVHGNAGGGGAGGGIINDLAGGAGGLFTPLRVGIGLVTAAFFALHKITHLLIEGIKYGTQAYINSARTGTKIGPHTQLTSALGILGISEEATQQMLLKGDIASQRGKGGIYGIGDTNAVINTAKSSGFGSANQLMNMAKEFDFAMKNSANNARQTAQVAKSNLYTSMFAATVGREWKTLWTQISALASPVFNSFLILLQKLLAGINWILEKTIQIGKYAAGGLPGTNKVSIGGGNILQSSWEKMGFVLKSGKGSPEHALQKTAENTTKMVSLMEKMIKSMTPSGPGGVFGVNHLPSMA